MKQISSQNLRKKNRKVRRIPPSRMESQLPQSVGLRKFQQTPWNIPQVAHFFKHGSVGVFGSLCQSLRISDEWFMAHEDSSISVIKFRLWQPFTSFALHSQPAPAAVVRRQGCDKSDGRTPKACAEDWEISHFSTHWRDWHQWSAARLNRFNKIGDPSANGQVVKDYWQFSASDSVF